MASGRIGGGEMGRIDIDIGLTPKDTRGCGKRSLICSYSHKSTRTPGPIHPLFFIPEAKRTHSE